MTDETAKKPEWATAYEAGYRTGYQHGLDDARRALHGQDDSQATPDAPPVDVSRTDVGLSPASPPVLRVLRP